MLVDVLLPLNFDNAFTYNLNTKKNIKVGTYVLVPFKNKEIVGIIWETKPKIKKDIKLREIIKVFDIHEMSKSQLELIKKMSNYNLINQGLILNLFLYKQGFKSFDKGLKKITDFKIYEPKINAEEKLNSDQNKIFKEIKKNINFKKFNTSLIKGIPGSGKTHIYFEIIKSALKNNHQVLVLLPEKALSEQIAKRFKEFFNYQPAIWHSGIKDKEKKKIWKGVLENKIKLIIGARSSLFLPFRDLKLIIIDEEHDASYKQDEGVSFNARDMAILKASIEKFPIFLISATPTVETYFNAKQKKYFLYELNSRFNNSTLPEIKTVKLSKENITENNFISENIVEEINDFLKEKNQVLFFLNRRGFSSFIFCYKCMKRLECPNCSVGLVFHKNKNLASCHYCSYSTKLSRACKNEKEKCEFKLYGVGVEKIFQEVKKKFPDYKADILSSDFTDFDKFSKQLEAIEDNKINIIVATQIISKGFNFKNLNMIIVVNADTNFIGNDIRSTEKNFQLLCQLSGRAGRFNKKSKIFLQTFDEKNKIFESLKDLKTEEFYNNEIEFRKNSNFPPFYKFISIIVMGRNEYEVNKFALKIKSCIPKHDLINVYGPVAALISKIKSNFRSRILVKYNSQVTPQKVIKEAIQKFKIPSNLKLQIDVDPLNFS